MKYLILLCFLSMSCSLAKKDIAGYYISHQPAIGSIFGKYISGSSLKLAQDSAFTREDCAQVTTGRWKVKNDSLLLYCEDIRYLMDSLNVANGYEYGKFCNDQPDVMFIDGNKLTAERKMVGGLTVKDVLSKE